jgi:hypothetical protein
LRFRVECKSLLLQKALEEFLKDYLFEDGMVISDEKGDIIIGKDIKKPFSRSQLLLQLEKIWQKRDNKKEIHNLDDKLEQKLEIEMDIFDDLIQKEENRRSNSFEEKLDILIDEFSTKLKNLIKEEYGKK